MRAEHGLRKTHGIAFFVHSGYPKIVCLNEELFGVNCIGIAGTWRIVCDLKISRNSIGIMCKGGTFLTMVVEKKPMELPEIPLILK